MGQEFNHNLEQQQDNKQQVASTSPGHHSFPISYQDIILGGMQAANLDPQSFAEKRARRFIDQHLLHHKTADNPYTHLAAAERAEDAHDLLRAEAELTKAIQTADRLKPEKLEKALDRTRKDETHETEIGQSLREKGSQEDMREQLLTLPVMLRLEAANFYAFHNQQPEADKLRNEAVAKVQDLPPSIQRHILRVKNQY